MHGPYIDGTCAARRCQQENKQDRSVFCQPIGWCQHGKHRHQRLSRCQLAEWRRRGHAYVAARRSAAGGRPSAHVPAVRGGYRQRAGVPHRRRRPHALGVRAGALRRRGHPAAAARVQALGAARRVRVPGALLLPPPARGSRRARRRRAAGRRASRRGFARRRLARLEPGRCRCEGAAGSRRVCNGAAARGRGAVRRGRGLGGQRERGAAAARGSRALRRDAAAAAARRGDRHAARSGRAAARAALRSGAQRLSRGRVPPVRAPALPQPLPCWLRQHNLLRGQPPCLRTRPAGPACGPRRWLGAPSPAGRLVPGRLASAARGTQASGRFRHGAAHPLGRQQSWPHDKVRRCGGMSTSVYAK